MSVVLVSTHHPTAPSEHQCAPRFRPLHQLRHVTRPNDSPCLMLCAIQRSAPRPQRQVQSATTDEVSQRATTATTMALPVRTLTRTAKIPSSRLIFSHIRTTGSAELLTRFPQTAYQPLSFTTRSLVLKSLLHSKCWTTAVNARASHTARPSSARIPGAASAPIVQLPTAPTASASGNIRLVPSRCMPSNRSCARATRPLPHQCRLYHRPSWHVQIAAGPHLGILAWATQM